MSETVIILGAGASKEAGGPLMKEFLDTSDSLLRSGRAGSEQQHAAFDLVFRGIAALQSAFAKATLESDNLEAVFAAFEMAELFESLPPLEDSNVRKLSSALRTVIVRTLEQTITLPLNTNMSREAANDFPFEAPPPYARFAGGLKQLIGRKRDVLRSAAIFTFNYDLALDYALHEAGIPVDYCLDTGDSGIDGLNVLKLHGSLNWVRCDHCQRIVPFRLQRYFDTYRPDLRAAIEARKYYLEVGQHLTSFVHCPNQPPPHVAEPIIVPPTWSKTALYREIGTVWRRAAKHLAEARNILVIGYSLPETDQFFRYLYALGTVSAQRLQRFWVIDIDVTRTVEDRFRQMLGPLALRRFQYMPHKFSDVVEPVIQVIEGGAA